MDFNNENDHDYSSLNTINDDYNVNNLDSLNVLNSGERVKYKLTLTRKRNFVGCLISFDIYIDDEKVGKIKNGKTVVLDVPYGVHTVSINKNNPVNITINKDTTADVVVFGANNFGITNINGEGNNNSDVNPVNYLKKTKTNTNIVLIFSILLPIISIILLYTVKFYIREWVHGIVIGYAIVNIVGLKNLKGQKEYKPLLIKNIVAIVISIVLAVVISYLINFR